MDSHTVPFYNIPNLVSPAQSPGLNALDRVVDEAIARNTPTVGAESHMWLFDEVVDGSSAQIVPTITTTSAPATPHPLPPLDAPPHGTYEAREPDGSASGFDGVTAFAPPEPNALDVLSLLTSASILPNTVLQDHAQTRSGDHIGMEAADPEELKHLLYQGVHLDRFVRAIFKIDSIIMFAADPKFTAIARSQAFRSLFTAYLSSSSGDKHILTECFANLYNHVAYQLNLNPRLHFFSSQKDLRGEVVDKGTLSGALIPWSLEALFGIKLQPSWGNIILAFEIAPVEPKAASGNTSTNPAMRKPLTTGSNLPRPSLLTPNIVDDGLHHPGPNTSASSIARGLEGTMLSSKYPKLPASSEKRKAGDIDSSRPSKLLRVREKSNPMPSYLASCALDMLYSGPQRRFVLGCHVKGTEVELWYFDRAGGVGAETFDMEQHPESFIALVSIIADANDDQLGFEPLLQSTSPYPASCERTHLTFGQNVFLINGIISSTRPFTGTGAFVLSAHWIMSENGTMHSQEVIVKISLQCPEGDSEYQLLMSASQMNITGIPTVLAVGNDALLSDGLRSHFSYLHYQDQVLRVLVMKGDCMPLSAVTDLETLMNAFKSLITVHHDLSERGILHCAIAPKSLMVEQGNPSQGVLVNFDSAIRTNNVFPRVATTPELDPWLATDLLSKTPPPHSYHHDLESFFWVMVWFATGGAYPVMPNARYESLGKLRSNKEGMLSDLPAFLPQFSPIYRGMVVLGQWINTQRECEGQDKKTLGVPITYEEFMIRFPSIARD